MPTAELTSYWEVNWPEVEHHYSKWSRVARVGIALGKFNSQRLHNIISVCLTSIDAFTKTTSCETCPVNNNYWSTSHGQPTSLRTYQHGQQKYTIRTIPLCTFVEGPYLPFKGPPLPKFSSPKDFLDISRCDIVKILQWLMKLFAVCRPEVQTCEVTGHSF